MTLPRLRDRFRAAAIADAERVRGTAVPATTCPCTCSCHTAFYRREARPCGNDLTGGELCAWCSDVCVVRQEGGV